MIKRRAFISLLGGAAVWPLAARAQESGRTYRLGFLSQVGRNTPGIVAFFDQALNFLASSLFFVHRRIAFEHVAVVHLPAIYQWPEMAEEGGLVGYGSRFTEMYRQRAQIVVKILRGAKPADIPVEQPTRFELVINLKAARAIDHEVPAGLVLRADKVIE
jgi:ABC transporter substrate binding protein